MKTSAPSSKIGMKGFFTITSRVPDGEGGLRVHQKLEFQNLITNNGLNGIGTNGTAWSTTIALGTGTATPNVSDTSLSGTVISVTSGTSTGGDYTAGTPRYRWGNWSKTFAQGAATGTWTEIGIGRSSTNLWSRARILDSGGSPSSITITAIEVLTVEYRLEVYQDETEHTGTIMIGGVIYDWTTRAYGGLSAFTMMSGSLMAGPSAAGYACGVWSGALNANYVLPTTGTEAGGATAVTVAAYVSGSYEKIITFSFPIGGGNLAGGISAMTPLMYGDSFNGGDRAGKIGFVPSIPKDNTKIMTMTFKWTWGRL